MKIPVRELGDNLEIRIETNKIKGQIPTTCTELACSDRSDNWECYCNFEDCLFYKAYLIQIDYETKQAVEIKRQYQR